MEIIILVYFYFARLISAVVNLALSVDFILLKYSSIMTRYISRKGVSYLGGKL